MVELPDAEPLPPEVLENAAELLWLVLAPAANAIDAPPTSRAITEPAIFELCMILLHRENCTWAFEGNPEVAPIHWTGNGVI